jgi:hypothetical protein
MKRAIVELRYVGLPPATQIARGKVTLAVRTVDAAVRVARVLAK